MVKLRHATLVMISGLVWLAVGCFLLPLGLKLLVESAYHAPLTTGNPYPFIESLAPYLGGVQEAALFIIVMGLFIGYSKGKYVLGKSVKRSVTRIKSFPNPTSLANLYSKGYYLLFGSMVLLGMSIKWLGLSNDIRGAIDVAVGSALINGAVQYFRLALEMRPIKS